MTKYQTPVREFIPVQKGDQEERFILLDGEDVLCQCLGERKHRVVGQAFRRLETGLDGYYFGVVDLEGGEFANVITQCR
jgi:hypothetical protein